MYRAYHRSKRVYVSYGEEGWTLFASSVYTSWTPPRSFIKRFCIHPWVTFVNKEPVSPFWVHTYDWHVLMTFAQVVETSVTCNNNRPVKDFTLPDDHIPPTSDMILGVKPFALYIDYFGFKVLFLGFHKFALFDRPGTIYSVTVGPNPVSLRGTSSTDHDLPRDDRLCLYITEWKPGTE